MKLYLRDINQPLIEEWQRFFKDESDVHISQGNIFAPGEHMQADAIISPANSFGFMDGGIDYTYSEFFGWEMQERLQEKLWVNYCGELLVGQAEMIAIRDSSIKYLISAPTMRVPMDIRGTLNVYLATRAALRLAKNTLIESVLCPGMGTGVGKVPYDVCAKQMYCAWKWYENPTGFESLGDAHRHHYLLAS